MANSFVKLDHRPGPMPPRVLYVVANKKGTFVSSDIRYTRRLALDAFKQANGCPMPFNSREARQWWMRHYDRGWRTRKFSTTEIVVTYDHAWRREPR